MEETATGQGQNSGLRVRTWESCPHPAVTTYWPRYSLRFNQFHLLCWFQFEESHMAQDFVEDIE